MRVAGWRWNALPSRHIAESPGEPPCQGDGRDPLAAPYGDPLPPCFEAGCRGIARTQDPPARLDQEAADTRVAALGQLVGMNVPGYDNRQLPLNILHWLSRLL